MQERWWSLHRASVMIGLPEPELRARILSGDLVGIPTEDGREWLVRESDLRGAGATPRASARRPVSGSSGCLAAGLKRVAILLALFLLVGTLVVLFAGSSTHCTRHYATQAWIKQVSGQIEMFHLNHGRYPTQLRELLIRPGDVEAQDWPAGGYLADDALLDGWSREWIYQVPGTQGRPFDLFSLGEDPRNPAGIIRGPASLAAPPR